jgi:hypothetical protein
VIVGKYDEGIFTMAYGAKLCIQVGPQETVCHVPLSKFTGTLGLNPGIPLMNVVTGGADDISLIGHFTIVNEKGKLIRYHLKINIS